MPLNPRCSISAAISRVRSRRPRTAASEMAGMFMRRFLADVLDCRRGLAANIGAVSQGRLRATKQYSGVKSPVLPPAT